MRRRQPGDFFELRGQVMDAAETKLECDFGERKLVIHQQFLDFFNPEQDKVLLDGFAFDRRKNIAQIAVIVWDRCRNERRQVGLLLPDVAQILCDQPETKQPALKRAVVL